PAVCSSSTLTELPCSSILLSHQHIQMGSSCNGLRGWNNHRPTEPVRIMPAKEFELHENVKSSHCRHCFSIGHHWGLAVAAPACGHRRQKSLASHHRHPGFR